MDKQYFSYIRVSTLRQGERGVSLLEQQDAIVRYARAQNLTIVRSFEEMVTAAKQGRPVFNQMLRLLKRGEACGVIIHKIDRGARNLKDWADLGELIDAGVEVHFANESLDLNTRGGRLSADIQAVVASDYIRNLREETRKGFYGRLKQGFYPLSAPLGYLDRGGGQAKVLDPATSPLIAEAFALYATGSFSLLNLLSEMRRRGLRNRKGGSVSLNGISRILNNSFYVGVVRIKKTGEHFAGVHQPLIDRRTFDTVQAILDGKTVPRTHRHEFPFSRMIRCGLCGHTTMVELQKGHIYYRCHTRDCATKTIRQEQIESALDSAFAPLRLNEEEIEYARLWFTAKRSNWKTAAKEQIEACTLQLAQIRERLTRLTDAFLDGAVDKTILDERRAELLFTQAGIQRRLHDAQAGEDPELARLEQYLELIKSVQNLNKLTTPREKRDLVRNLTSNLYVTLKSVEIALTNEAQLLADRPKVSYSSPHRGVPRTWDALFQHLSAELKSNPILELAQPREFGEKFRLAA